MKKTLLTSLFCAAITLSSLIGIKNNNQCNTKQTNNENIVLPKQQKQNAKAIYERDLDSISEYSADNLGLSLISKEKDKPIEKYNKHSDNGVHDDFSDNATTVESNDVCITGRINKHNLYERARYRVSEKDEDWFKFSVKEKFEYKFTFTAPNSGYVFNMYKYRGKQSTPLSEYLYIGNDSVLQDWFVMTGTSVKIITLNPGTYFLKITTDTLKNIVSNSYSLVFEQTSVNREKGITLNASVKESNVMALWENDLLPDNAQRWLGEDQQVRYLSSGQMGDASIYYEEGYVDPIYEEEGRYLDSVLLIWNTEILEKIEEIISGVQLALYQAFEDYNKTYGDVRKLEVWYEPWLGFGLDLFMEGIGYTEYAPLATGLNLLSSYNEATAYGANFLVQNVRDILNENIFGSGGFFQGIRTGIRYICDMAQYTSEVPMLCIPRYAQVKQRVYESDITADKIYSLWSPSFDGIDMAYQDYYFFESDYLSSFQNVHLGSWNKTYHGETHLFETGQDFIDYTGLDYRQYIRHYDPAFGEFRVLEKKQPLSELELYFGSSNDYMNNAGFMFEESGRVMFFTRSPNPTTIEIYDELGNRLRRGGSGGIYHGNAFLTFNVEAFKRYRVEVTMTPTYESSCYGYLDVIQQPNSYGYYGDINHIEHDFEEDILKIEGAGLEAFLGFEQGYTAVYSFVPQFNAAYILSTYYSEEYYTYFLPMSGVSCSYYSLFSSGRHDADYVWLNEGETCLVVVARKDRFAELGNNNYYGLMIDVRCVEGDS